MALPSSSPRSPIGRRSPAWLVLLAASGLLFAACGGSSDGADAAGADDATTPTELAEEPTADPTTNAPPDADTICAQITEEDMAAILPEAELTGASPNAATALASCDYSIDIGGVDGPVIQIRQEDTDGQLYASQRAAHADAADVPGVADAFSYDDAGTIVVRTGSGTYTIERGVELTEGGQPASNDQMIAIAAEVAAL